MHTNRLSLAGLGRRRALRRLGLGAAVAFAVPTLFALSGGTATAGTARCDCGPCAPACGRASKPHSKAHSKSCSKARSKAHSKSCSKARSKAHSCSQSKAQSKGHSKSHSKGHSKSCSHS